MTKKTRIRVARIAAGAVIAAGASLMVAGVAQADGAEPDPSCGIIGTGPECEQEPTNPEPTNPEPTNPEPTDPEPTDPEPTNPEPTNPEPTGPGVPTTPEKPTGKPTEPTEEPTETAPGGGTGGGNAADPNGGPSAQEEGSSALTDTGDEAPAPSAQSDGKELAETGAAEMTFLVVGAATMIAGGIGFRVLPRLMTGRGGAAA
ncbi:hypothetical protein [Streptomyces viridosporus]|uniref:hypothetical protein n=1 Tax=Streptomyces viridosporus TaxID=67581 RepID=UPI0036F7A891